MKIDIEKIKKLPPDVRKDFMKTFLQYEEKKKENKIHSDFMAFVKHVWPEFIEGSHHKIVAEKFNQLAEGKLKRLIINMPPRHTKSEFASFLLPAWMVGRNPKLKLSSQPIPQSYQLDSGVKQKHLSIHLSINKYLKLDSEKIHKPQVNGRHKVAASITQPVSVQQSQVVVLTY